MGARGRPRPRARGGPPRRHHRPAAAGQAGQLGRHRAPDAGGGDARDPAPAPRVHRRPRPRRRPPPRPRGPGGGRPPLHLRQRRAADDRHRRDPQAGVRPARLPDLDPTAAGLGRPAGRAVQRRGEARRADARRRARRLIGQGRPRARLDPAPPPRLHHRHRRVADRRRRRPPATIKVKINILMSNGSGLHWPVAGSQRRRPAVIGPRRAGPAAPPSAPGRPRPGSRQAARPRTRRPAGSSASRPRSATPAPPG